MKFSILKSLKIDLKSFTKSSIHSSVQFLNTVVKAQETCHKFIEFLKKELFHFFYFNSIIIYSVF